MNYNSETKKLTFCETAFETTAEQSVEADLTLPDYCPEIRKILRCSVAADVISVQTGNGKVTVQGNATVKVIYVGENGNVSSFENTQPLQKTVESDVINSESSVDVRINVDYVNGRAVSPRRIDVRAMTTFVICVRRKRNETVLCRADGCGIQSKSEEYVFSNLVGLCTKGFNLTEVVEISDSKNPVSQILNTSAFAFVNDVKVINNKILIKGDCAVKIHYLCENKDAVDCVEHSIPISQIIEVEGVTENSVGCLSLKVTSCETSGKVDTSGMMRLVDMNIRISASFVAYDDVSLEMITDAYSTSKELKNTVKSLEMCKVNKKFDTMFINKVVIESIGVSVDSVLGVWCGDLKCTSALKGRSCVLSGNYQATVLYRDADGQAAVVQKPVEFEYEIELSGEPSGITCNPSLQIAACSCSLAGESKLEIKTEINACGIILENKIVRYVSDIEVLDDIKNSADSCALTIYFSDENEKIWNIAKKYKTTVRAIMDENGLEDEIVGTRRFLLIPAV